MAKQGNILSASEWELLKELVYDKFVLEVRSLQVLMGSSLPELRLALDASRARTAAGAPSPSPFHLVEETNATMTIGQSIGPSILELPRVRVHGEIAGVRVRITRERYHDFMRILDSILSSFFVPRPEATVAGAAAAPGAAVASPTPLRLGKALPPRETSVLPLAGGDGAAESDAEDSDSDSDDGHDTRPGPTVAVVAAPVDHLERWRQVGAEVNLTIKGASVVLDTLAEVTVSTLTLAVADRAHDTAVRMAIGSLALTSLARGRRNDIVTLQPLPPAERAAAGPTALDDVAVTFSIVDVRQTSPELMSTHGGRLQTLDLVLTSARVRVDVEVFLPFLTYTLETFVPTDGDPLKSVVNAAPINLIEALLPQQVPAENTDQTRLTKLHFTAAFAGSYNERSCPLPQNHSLT